MGNVSVAPRLLLNTEPALRRGWHPVCTSAELGTEPLRIRLLGSLWELCRNAAGAPVATASDCGPAYAVTDSIGLVWLAPLEPVAQLLDAPELDDPAFSSGWLDPKHTTSSAALYLDNQLDASHFPFVHTTTFGNASDPLVPHYSVESTPGGFTAGVAHAFRNVLDPGVATGERPIEQVRRVSYRFALPLQLQLRIDHLQTGQRTVILFGTCPRDEGSTQLWVRVLRNDIPGHPGIAAETMPEVLAFENRVVAEDLAFQETFDLPGLPLDTSLELPVRADQCGLELRKLLRRLCAENPQPTPSGSSLAGVTTLMAEAATVSGFGVFGVAETGELAAFFRANGFAILRGLWSPERLAKLEAACTDAQEALLRGELDPVFGTAALVDDAKAGATPIAHYVTRITELSAVVRDDVMDPVIEKLVTGWLGDCWLLEGEPFGVVLQDARPGRESAYTRIGWHTDWQSSTHLDRWPGVAFTVHLDATSPANGFLRVVPGSHLWATPAPARDSAGNASTQQGKPFGGHTDTPPPLDMPLGFAKVPGEIAVYCEEGDLLFHDSFVWHSAARATDDDTRRRHVRGTWHSGKQVDSTIDDFLKNAAR